MKAILDRLLFPAQYATQSLQRGGKNVFGSRAVLLSLASSLYLLAPAYDRCVGQGVCDRKDLADAGKALAIAVGGVCWRYAKDDEQYTPSWLPGRNKTDVK